MARKSIAELKTEMESSFPNARLRVELVPQTCWFSNVRDHVSKAQWDSLRKPTYQKANYVCEICGGRGPKWPVECHEIWSYDDVEHTQKLLGLISLCPNCHAAKHIGFAQLQGRGELVTEHLAKVNGWTKGQTGKYLGLVWEIWEKRSQHDWKLDFLWLDALGVHIIPKR